MSQGAGRNRFFSKLVKCVRVSFAIFIAFVFCLFSIQVPAIGLQRSLVQKISSPGPNTAEELNTNALQEDVLEHRLQAPKRRAHHHATNVVWLIDPVPSSSFNPSKLRDRAPPRFGNEQLFLRNRNLRT